MRCEAPLSGVASQPQRHWLVDFKRCSEAAHQTRRVNAGQHLSLSLGVSPSLSRLLYAPLCLRVDCLLCVQTGSWGLGCL